MKNITTALDEEKRRWEEFVVSKKSSIKFSYIERRLYRPVKIGVPQKGDVCMDSEGSLWQVFVDCGELHVICEEVKG